MLVHLVMRALCGHDVGSGTAHGHDTRSPLLEARCAPTSAMLCTLQDGCWNEGQGTHTVPHAHGRALPRPSNTHDISSEEIGLPFQGKMRQFGKYLFKMPRITSKELKELITL